jgi:hypothetical protein
MSRVILGMLLGCLLGSAGGSFAVSVFGKGMLEGLGRDRKKTSRGSA